MKLWCPKCKSSNIFVSSKCFVIDPSKINVLCLCVSCNQEFNIVCSPSYIVWDDANGYTIVLPIDDYKQLGGDDVSNSL